MRKFLSALIVLCGKLTLKHLSFNFDLIKILLTVLETQLRCASRSIFGILINEIIGGAIPEDESKEIEEDRGHPIQMENMNASEHLFEDWKHEPIEKKPVIPPNNYTESVHIFEQIQKLKFDDDDSREVEEEEEDSPVCACNDLSTCVTFQTYQLYVYAVLNGSNLNCTL